MKTRSRSLFFVGLCTFALLASAGNVFAQKKLPKLKNIKAPKQTFKTYKQVKPVQPNVSPAAAQRAVTGKAATAPVSSTSAKAVAPKTLTSLEASLERAAIPKTDVALKATAPKAAVQPPAPPADPVNPEDFVLTLKPVEAYYPTWRQELGGFSKGQLDAVEQAFAATDEWMFVRGEDGELKARNKDEWDYEARFLTILQNSGVSFTDKQIKQLIGGKGISGFTFGHYFTFKKTLAHVLAKGNRPRKGTTEGGKLLSVAELNKRAEAGDGQADELARELTLGQKINGKGWVNDPVHGDMQALITNEAYLNQAVNKTPDEWLELIEAFVREHNRWPSQSTKAEKQLYNGADKAMRNNPNHPASVKMRELNDQYEGLHASRKTPDEWLELIEAFVREHNRWPSQTTKAEKQLYVGARDAMLRNPNHPASVRMRELNEQYEGLIASPKTPDEWLELIEAFVREHNRWPSYSIEEEKQLYKGANNTMRRNPNHPASVKMRELNEQYDGLYAARKTPAEYVELARQYSTKPRATIYRNGHYLSRAEMTPEEVKEVIIGNWLSRYNNHPLVEEYMQENRLHAEAQTTQQLYTALTTHIKDHGHYPTWAESSLQRNIYDRLRYYQSTVADGQYADPWLQKIYEIKLWSERVKRGEVNWQQMPGVFKKHRRTIGEMRAAGLLPQPEVMQEFAALPAEEKQAIEQMADTMLTLWEDFEGVWWQQNRQHVITTPQTQLAFNTVLNTVRNQVPGENNVNISNVLEQLSSMQLGQDGPDYYHVIYRGNNPRIPRAEDFHNVWESQGIAQADAAKAYKLNSPHIELDGDEEMVYKLLVRQGVTDKEMSAVIDALTPEGWEIRFGAHELLSEIKQGKVHIHIEQVVPTTEEDAKDISNVLRVDLRALTSGKNPQQTAKTLRYLFGKYLKEDGHQALNNIQKAF